jgi:hypothetical protein
MGDSNGLPDRGENFQYNGTAASVSIRRHLMSGYYFLELMNTETHKTHILKTAVHEDDYSQTLNDSQVVRR